MNYTDQDLYNTKHLFFLSKKKNNSFSQLRVEVLTCVVESYPYPMGSRVC